MAKKARSGRRLQLENLEMALSLNGQAKEDSRKRKHWSIHDLSTVKPLTPAQEELFHVWMNGDNICAHGSAGTGKSFLASYLALNEVLQQHQNRIIIVRSAVPTRDIGFMPGDQAEKLAVYEAPYHDIFHELLGRKSTYQDMKDAGLVEFHCTSFMRGLTWDNAVVVVDEASNMTFHEIDNIMTRLGKNTRIIFTGDVIQSDLTGKRGEVEGFSKAMNAFGSMRDFSLVTFTKDDIVRSNLVKSWIIAVENSNAA